MAGLNAARAASGADGVTLARDEAYIGVMIDDLITRGVTEPYRMFTSRAEFRLTLRADNADQRLTPKGDALGLVQAARRQRFGAKAALLDQAKAQARLWSLTPSEAAAHGFRVNPDGLRRSLLQLLAHPEIGLESLSRVWPAIGDWSPAVREQIEIEGVYAGYLDRQAADVAAFRRDEHLHLDSDIDYGAVGGLSSEAREKLSRIRPRTLGQASRMEGVTPGALTALLAHVRRQPA